jgi:hypothetical protein
MTLRITGLLTADFQTFADYLNDHLSDNGAEGLPLFQPIARSDCHFQGDRAAGFRCALDVQALDPGWRRVWVAVLDQAMVGHVDLRAHPSANMGHRCLLGMGVHRDWRRSGIGQQSCDIWSGSQATLS